MLFIIPLILFFVSNPIAGNLNFSYDYTVTKLSSDTFIFQSYYNIPYEMLYFTKCMGRSRANLLVNTGATRTFPFIARYQISLELWDKNNIINGKIFTRELMAVSYEETNLQKKLHLDSINMNFTIPVKTNNKLLTKIRISDLNSSNQGTAQFHLLLPKIIGKIRFYNNSTPNPQRSYSTEPSLSETLNVSLEIYSDSIAYCSSWVTKDYDVRYLSKSERTKVKKQSSILTQFHQIQQQTINLKPSFFTFTFSYPLNQFTDLVSGQYLIKIAGYNYSNKKLFEITDSFSLGNSFFYSDADYFEIVVRLMYIATETELRNLKAVLPSERDSAWRDFWEKHDPTPTTAINESEQEYFLRIDYCIKNFSKGDKGYKSDRAKIYMKYDKPDFVETRPFEQFSNAYEIWYYYSIGKQFIFTDAHGFGEFTLYQEKRI